MSDKEISIIIRLMGIRPTEWPINAYRWFGLKEGEDDPAIIEAACDDLERKLQRIISSYNKDPSEDEKAVARALWEQSFWRKKVLQDPTLKTEYDATMKREQRYFSHVRSVPLARRQEEPLNSDPPLPQAPSVIKSIESTEISTPMVNTKKAAPNPLALLKRKQVKKKRQQILIRVLLTIVAIVSGAVLAYILLRTK